MRHCSSRTPHIRTYSRLVKHRTQKAMADSMQQHHDYESSDYIKFLFVGKVFHCL
jgi:hypothetical protein